MKRSGLLTALVLIYCGCSGKTAGIGSGSNAPGSASHSSGSAVPPTEDMASIPAGSYSAADPVFSPDGSGACSPALLARVGELAKQAPWPDRAQDVSAFAIDKRRVSCRDYKKCVTAGACRALDVTKSCSRKDAQVALDQAVAYCRWRGGKLPTLLQWQAAVRGPSGKVAAECDASAGSQECTFTSELGVTAVVTHRWNAEFTSTSACWPGDARQPAAVRPIDIAALAQQLNLFVPVIPRNDSDVDEAWFRCVRTSAVSTSP